MKTGKNTILLVLLLFLICISVMYVAAAEEKSDSKKKTSSWKTILLSSDLTKRDQIRMANEDALVVETMAISSVQRLSQKEYDILTRIVEAEATGKDTKSKILVANVVLNRMKSNEFPDTVEEVVFQRVSGVVQFSPIADGRYYSVDVTDTTKDCVDRALAGEDYSKGALYFMERSMSEITSVRWFDENLTRLFEHEGHEFYR